MLERGNYDARALAVFDTIGAYFVDVMYNNLYTLSRDLVQRGGVNNITDAYRGMVVNYMNGVVTRDDCFKKVVYSLHEYYQTHQHFSSLLNEFQDKVLSQFIPPEYYRDFTGAHKDKTLRDIVNTTVNELGEAVIAQSMLRRIVDDHLNYINIEELRTVVTNALILQREEYYTKFASERTRPSNTTVTIDRSVVKRLKKAYMEEKRKACDLAADKDRAINMIRQLWSRVEELEARMAAITAQTDKPSLPPVISATIHAPADETRGRSRNDTITSNIQRSDAASESHQPITTTPARRHVHIPPRAQRATLNDSAPSAREQMNRPINKPQVNQSINETNNNKISPSAEVSKPETTMTPAADEILPTLNELIGDDHSDDDGAAETDLDDDEIHRRQREAADRWAIGGDPWTADSV
jgi:hypothetical protein